MSAGLTRDEETAHAKISPARRIAFQVLALVESGKGHSDDLLHEFLTDSLSVEDRNLATALVMGVLRWQIALDARVVRLLQRPEQRLAEPVQLALRMGALQLLHMDRIPAHAALSESVELCRAFGQPHAAGMVNAVLRKLASAQPAGKRVFESTAAFAERLGHPLWLAERWVARFGREAALTICMADQSEPSKGRMFVDVSDGGRPELPAMDDGSRLIAEIAAAALPKVSGRAARIWDCCAAPGGKTLVLALRTEGAELLATDISVRRLRHAENRLKGYSYGRRVRWVTSDATALTEGEGSFDLILCDVPCSGTGTLARNPEIRHRLTSDEFARQAQRQSAILSAVLGRLSPGGRVVYSTCSLEREENEDVVEKFVGAGYRLVDVNEMLTGVGNLSDPKEIETAVQAGVLRTLPGMHPCDGFFAAVLEKT